MSGENPNSANYTNQNQLDFATEMAKFLAKKKGYQMTPQMAVLPGSWKYGVGDSLDAIIGGLYQNRMNQLSGDIDANKLGEPTYKQGPSTVGTALSSGLGAQLRKLWQGSKTASLPPSDDKSLETGSLNPEPPKEDAEEEPKAPIDTSKMGLGDQGVSPGEVGDQTQRDPTSARPITDMTDPRAVYNSRPRTDPIKRVVFHWDDASPEGLVKYGRQVDQKRGFDPGYHYIIGRDGNIIQAAPDDKVTNHAYKNNRDTLGIVFAQSDKNNPPTREQEDAGQWLAAKLGAQYGINPKNVFGHGELPGQDREPGEAGVTPGLIRKNGFVKNASFDEEDAPPGLLTGRRSLGGPAGDDVERSMVPQSDNTRVAQSFQAQSGVTNPTARDMINPPGYSGPAPSAPYVETKNEIFRQMQGTSDPAEKQRILEAWKKKQEPIHVPAVNGTLEGTPQQGGKPVLWKFIPAAKGPEIKNIPTAPVVGPDTQGTAPLVPNVPGVGQPGGIKRALGPESAVGEIERAEAERGARSKNITEIAGTQTSNIASAIKEANEAPAALQAVGIIDKTIRSSPNLSFGPQAPYMNDVKRVLDNYYPGMSTSIASADSLEKQSTLLARDLDKSFSSRGTNFQLETFLQAVPSLRASKEGALLIADLIKQDISQRQRLGDHANLLGDEDPAVWNRVKQNYYANNPLVIHQPAIGKDPAREIVVKDFQNGKEVKAFAEKNPQYSGMKFMTVRDGKTEFGTIP